uniref:Uncharacterized protein n=1 Tax=Onchocerca volvulus TaxID=6282 RepID=A0A8R1TXV7_ONCVO
MWSYFVIFIVFQYFSLKTAVSRLFIRHHALTCFYLCVPKAYS